MKLRNLIAAAAVAALPLTAGAATLIIPAAGTGPGANNSRWQSEVTLHNTGGNPVAATLTYHDRNGATATASVAVPARATISVADIVATKFNVQSGTGAIEINVSDAEAAHLAVSSRTVNVTDRGVLGQDIAVVSAKDAPAAGDVVVITGPADVGASRFNFGLYSVTESTVRWQLIRADGSVEATQDVTYAAGQQQQYDGGALTFFNATARNDDVLHASLTKGSAVFYGSIIDSTSGDPTFVAGIRTREESRIHFTGVDRDLNGLVEISDANHDNVLDAPISTLTLGFPDYFRVLATGDDGEKVTFEIVSSPSDARIIDDNGTIQIVASAALKGTTGDLKVRITTADGLSTVVTIPVKFM